jgi:outer membrane immunogenic protein
MKKLALLAALLLGAISPAAAADIPSWKDSRATDVPDPVAGDRQPFAGLAIGLSAQWDRLDVSHSGSLTFPEGDGPGDRLDAGFADMDGDGFGFGAQAGYQWQIGRVYFGPRVRGSINDADASMDASGITSLSFNGSPAQPVDVPGELGSLSIQNDWQAILDVKLGLAITDRIGIYGFVGYGAASLEATATANVGDGISVTHDDTATGLVYGAGVDLKITENWEAFVEYQRFDLGDFSASGAVPGAEFIRYGYQADVNLDAVRFGVNHRF